VTSVTTIPLFHSSMLAARTSTLRSSSIAVGLRIKWQHYPPTTLLISGHKFSYYSTPTSTQTPSSKSSSLPPPPSNQRKQKVELRPGPVKPQKPPQPSLSFTLPAVDNQTIDPTRQTTLSTSTQSLSDLKQEALRDIEVAEAHGILKPPPADANWFRRTLHKGIELAVRTRIVQLFTSL
jgi:hypothetical protein